MFSRNRYYILIFAMVLLSLTDSISQNTVTIRSDRILEINGTPFFPLGVYLEITSSTRHPDGYNELQGNGFNLINLDWGTHQLEGSLFDSKGMISRTSLPSITSYTNPANASRILTSANAHDMFILADFMPFHENASIFDSWALTINQTFREDAIDNLTGGYAGLDVASDDAFLGWYSRDEPLWSIDVTPRHEGDYTPALVSDRYNNMLQPSYTYLKSRDPNHIVFMNFCFAQDTRFPPTNLGYTDARSQFITDVQLYSQAADIIAHDVYPIWFWGGGITEWTTNYSDTRYKLFSNDEISLVGDYTKLLYDAVSKPIWTVLETKMEENESYATYDHLRFEAYHAIINGATGLIWYGWQERAHNDPIWVNQKNLVHDEFAESTPNSLYHVLTSRNSTNSLTITEVNSDIEYLLKEYVGFYYLIAVNRANTTGSATISGFGSTVPSGEVLFESRNVALSSGSFTDNFGPFDVHVYKIFRGLITDDETWGPGVLPDITGDITIQNGATVTILPNTTVGFDGYYDINVNSGSKILAQGTAAEGIDFTLATGTSATKWGYIRLNGGDNVFEYCTFENGYYPVYLYNCTSSEGDPNEFSYCTFTNNESYGMRVNGSVAEIVGCAFTNNSSHGIYCYNSDVDFTGNRFESNNLYGVYSRTNCNCNYCGNVIMDNASYGMRTMNGDIVYLGIPYNANGYNTIADNGSHELYAGSGSPHVHLNYNSISDNTGYEVYNYPSNIYYVFAQNCWWGDGTPSYNTKVTLSGIYGGSPSWHGDIYIGGPFLGKSVETPSGDPNEDFLVDPRLLPEERIERCKEIISKQPGEEDAREALGILWTIARTDIVENKIAALDKIDTYLNELWLKHPNAAVRRMALRYLIFWNMIAQNDGQVINLSKTAMNIFQGDDQRYLLEDLAETYLKVGDINNAEVCLNELKKREDQDEHFSIQLAQDIYETKQTLAKEKNQQNEPEPSVKLSESKTDSDPLVNYPNPGNPSTAIRYRVEQRGRVRLQIYNLLGEKVKELINEIKQPGTYEVIWDGRDHRNEISASGLYVIRLETATRLITNKMTLVK